MINDCGTIKIQELYFNADALWINCTIIVAGAQDHDVARAEVAMIDASTRDQRLGVQCLLEDK